MNQKPTFKEYVKKGAEGSLFGDTPMGDFANDAASDKKFRDFTNWEELEVYLAFHGACPEAIEAAQEVFKRWQDS